MHLVHSCQKGCTISLKYRIRRSSFDDFEGTPTNRKENCSIILMEKYIIIDIFLECGIVYMTISLPLIFIKYRNM